MENAFFLQKKEESGTVTVIDIELTRQESLLYVPGIEYEYDVLNIIRRKRPNTCCGDIYSRTFKQNQKYREYNV